MIPKKIYFTWISDKPVPKKYQKFIDSWKRIMPDYEIHQITLENVKRGPFVDKAIEIKNYALAGHYARVQELYDNGGIYFDIDIEAVKPLDDLLDQKLVLGAESDWWVNNAVIIAQKGHYFLKACMDYMDAFPFDTDKIELETGPRMFTNIMKKRGWSKGKTGMFGDILVLPPKAFYPYHYDQFYTPECVTKDTYCVHHWANSWNNKVSIVIPCYNQAHWLSDAIESALAQTYKDIEVIVVNDGSKDNTSEVAKRYPNVKLIEQPNKGLSGARNSGIKKAAGGWILTLDADDKIHPDFVKKTIGLNDIVTTTLETFGDEKRIWKSNLIHPTYNDLVEKNHLNCCSLFKKDVWTSVGGYDEQMRDGYEDWDFWIRATKNGFNITRIDDVLFYYRKHGVSMVTHARKNHDKIMAYMRKKREQTEPIDIVIPLGKGSTWKNNELRYALRSIEKNIRNFRNIVIVGELPEWIKDVTHLSFTDESDVPSENIKNKIIAACKLPSLSKEFMVTNDDIFFLRPANAPDYPFYHKGDMSKAASEYGKTWYQDYLLNTINELKLKGKPTMHFDIHYPIRYNKFLFPEVMKRYWTKREMVVKSVYANALEARGMYMNDCKIRTYLTRPQIESYVEGLSVFSIGDTCLVDRAHGDKPMKEFLQETFPTKSRFEKW